jgi:hypothetical protein
VGAGRDRLVDGQHLVAGLDDDAQAVGPAPGLPRSSPPPARRRSPGARDDVDVDRPQQGGLADLGQDPAGPPGTTGSAAPAPPGRGCRGGPNSYAYAAGSPTNLTDPFGDNPLLVGCAVGAALGGGGTYLSQRLSGRKVLWDAVGASALTGCVSGLLLDGALTTATRPLTGIGKSADDSFDLFRHVGPDELIDIKKTGQFHPGGGSTEGKWFAESGVHAQEWGRILNNNRGQVITVRLPSEAASRMFRVQKLDGIGPARYAEDLAEFNGLVGPIRLWP